MALDLDSVETGKAGEGNLKTLTPHLIGKLSKVSNTFEFILFAAVKDMQGLRKIAVVPGWLDCC